jgi:hypothetical protein
LYLLSRQLSASAFLQAYQQLQLPHLIIAWLCFGGSFLLSSWNWGLLLRALGAPAAYGQVLAANLSGLFYSFLIPSALSSDAWRALRLYPSQKNLPALGMSILVDRLTGLVVFGGVLGLAWFVYPQNWPFQLASGQLLVPLFLLLLGGGGGLALAYLFPQTLRPYWDLAWALRHQGPALLWVTASSALVHALVSAMIYILALSFGVELNFFACWLLTELLTLAEFLPISVGGLGIREGLYVWMLVPLGLSAEQATVLSLAQFALMLLFSLWGGALELRWWWAWRYKAPPEST